MSDLVALWLPIILSAVVCFVASSIIWMASPLHKHDYKDPGAKEGPLLDLLRSQSFEPGVYYVPWCGGKGNKDPEAMARVKQGPWGMLIVQGCAPSMGKMLGLWFFHLVLMSVFIGYIASNALPHGASYLKVFQVVGATGFLAYAGYTLPLSIWHGLPWSQVPGRIVDGLIYALLTAGIFGWQWPKAVLNLPIPGMN